MVAACRRRAPSVPRSREISLPRLQSERSVASDASLASARPSVPLEAMTQQRVQISAISLAELLGLHISPLAPRTSSFLLPAPRSPLRLFLLTFVIRQISPTHFVSRPCLTLNHDSPSKPGSFIDSFSPLASKLFATHIS